MTVRTLRSASAFLLLASAAAPLAASGAQAREDAVLRAIDARRDDYAGVARRIWEWAEVGYQEERSSALLRERLQAAGFTVKTGVADIPTAFVAEYGRGKPVIGIIAEFDALPGLSQDAVPRRSPLTAGGPGHGCGHHLFGTAAVASAVAVKEWLAANGGQGTIRVYGTPAEEGGGGKVYMVRAGLFRDADVAIAWHPGDANEAWPTSSLANISGKFRFRGLAAHASASPEAGRSALDGVEAMNHMVNLMREHIPGDARIHYVITDGGKAPNVVPDFAEVYYYARHADQRILDPIWERIVAASKGAAMGTGTTVEHEVVNAVWAILPNEYLQSLQQRTLARVGGVTYGDDERRFAEELRKTLTGTVPPLDAAAKVNLPLQPGVGGSTDVGDVSWNVPTIQLSAATWVPGTPAHSWQAVAAGGTSIGTKGMMVAAKAMALSAIELLADPSHVAKAREEFDRRRGPGFAYATKVAGRKPPLDYRK